MRFWIFRHTFSKGRHPFCQVLRYDRSALAVLKIAPIPSLAVGGIVAASMPKAKEPSENRPFGHISDNAIAIST